MPNNMKQYRKTFLAPLETDLRNHNSPSYAAAHRKILTHFSELGHE